MRPKFMLDSFSGLQEDMSYTPIEGVIHAGPCTLDRASWYSIGDLGFENRGMCVIEAPF